MSRYLPILTTVISAAFAWIILARYRLKRQSYHLRRWGIGIGIYGAGTLIESAVTFELILSQAKTDAKAGAQIFSFSQVFTAWTLFSTRDLTV